MANVGLGQSKGQAGKDPAQQPLLVFEEGVWADKRMSLTKDTVVIGRGGTGRMCDIRLPDRQISRMHAEIRAERGRYLLCDLDSKNGTYLNGRPIEGPVELADGDEIQIALAQRIRFVGADATLPLETVTTSKRLRLDRRSRQVWVGSQEIVPLLSPAQFRLLSFLYSRAGRVCSRQEIIDAVWADAVREGVTDQALDALVRRLRRRLEKGNPEGRYIVTVRGHGFRLEVTSSADARFPDPL
jgi:DNA-binding winged helix-turn-helix (wHTH) protein